MKLLFGVLTILFLSTTAYSVDYWWFQLYDDGPVVFIDPDTGEKSYAKCYHLKSYGYGVLNEGFIISSFSNGIEIEIINNENSSNRKTTILIFPSKQDCLNNYNKYYK